MPKPGINFEKFISGLKNIEPLSNYDIIDKCKDQKNFKGVFMRYELNKKASKNECIIINLDESKN